MSGFVALATVASSVAIALPASAISFNLSFTTNNHNAGSSPLTVNALLATSDGSPTAIPNNTYTLTGISGTANGNAITGLSSTFGADNIFQWDGTTIIGLTDGGISFDTTSFSFNIFNFNTSSISEFDPSSLAALNNNTPYDGGSVTSLSLTPATPVPFDFDPSFGLLALGGAWTVRGCDLNIIHLLSGNRKPILIEILPELLPTRRS